MKGNGRGEVPTQVDLEEVEKRLGWRNREIWKKAREVRRLEVMGVCYWCRKEYGGEAGLKGHWRTCRKKVADDGS